MNAYNGGALSGALGLALHFLIATIWAFIYCILKISIPLPKYSIINGLLYGIFVYCMMNFVVLPLSAFPHEVHYTLRGLLIIMFCIGLPVSSAARGLHRAQKLSFKTVFAILFVISCGASVEATTSTATFAGGCYWCMEEAMEHVPGVVSVTSGFSSGVEAVQLQFDPAAITYQDLLTAFWKNVDPTDAGGQFCDRGDRYRSVIFYQDAQQQLAAEQSKKDLAETRKMKVATDILPIRDFRPVPESEQDYYKKKPYEYKQYKIRCGRERRLRAIWKEPKDKS
jgi:peptide methionine sulfoxide reductase MsrA